MTTTDDINKLLIKYIRSETTANEKVIIETRGGIRPDGEYIGIFWRSVSPLKNLMGDATFEFDEEKQKMTEKRLNSALCKVRITCFGDAAYNKAIELRFGLDRSNRYKDIWATIGSAGTSDLYDLSVPSSGKINQRVAFDYSFYVNFARDYVCDWFDKSAWDVNNDGEEIMPSQEVIICP